MFAPKAKKSRFVQYKHGAMCDNPCKACAENLNRIFERGTGPKLPQHFNCHCRYVDVEVMQAGTVSKLGENGPDYWLKHYGRLPDCYITKEEAIKLGWDNSKNTVAGKAPGKMLTDGYDNDKKKLPEAPGRIWYECDVDYVTGKRNRNRLYFSNHGLIFFSPDHGTTTFYFVE